MSDVKPNQGRPGKLAKRLWLLAKVVLVVAAVAGVVYWLKFAPVAVVKHTIGRGELVTEVMGTGTLETHFKATISPKISGLITKVPVDQGDRVSTGQVLMQLDDNELKRQVEIGQAGVATATAALDRLRADKARAVAVLEQARREHTRIQELMAQASAASVESDRALEALGVAEADLARAEAGIVEGQKQLASAEQTLEYYRAKLADTIIKAPFDGLVIRRDRDPGGVVVPGSSVMVLISTDEIWVSAWVDETEMARLKPGEPARVVFRSDPTRSYKGEVARLGREADRETREFVVDVLVRELPKNWAVGQRAEVYIETARQADAVIVPSSELVWRESSPGVFVEQQGHAAWRPIKLGLRGRETVEILEGVRAGDSVIVPADAKVPLGEGQRVKSR